MPRLPTPLRRLGAALLLRRVSRDLTAIATQLQAQTAVLTRLANQFAPIAPPADRPTVEAETGVTHLDPTELALALDFVARTRRDTGHTPDDDEVWSYLADEKTHDLALRLSQREAEWDARQLARLWGGEAPR